LILSKIKLTWIINITA